MGVLTNIYCIPEAPGNVEWGPLLNKFAEHNLVRSPFRSGSPFGDESRRSEILWPENSIAPETLHPSNSNLVLRDFEALADALAYLGQAADATITMDAPQCSFQVHPDRRQFSAALALYRFRTGFHLRVVVPEDLSDLVDEMPELADQPTEPRWQGKVTEILWIHGQCVPQEREFLGSPIHELLQLFWPAHLLLSDAFP
jgi:hypothetical protein